VPLFVSARRSAAALALFASLCFAVSVTLAVTAPRSFPWVFIGGAIAVGGAWRWLAAHSRRSMKDVLSGVDTELVPAAAARRR
jgi:hypothetical protein